MSSEQHPKITSTTVDHVVTITIDAPPVNALGPSEWVALRSAIDAVSNDRNMQAVVLQGTAGRFCAGADVAILAEPTDEDARMLTLVGDAAGAIRRCRVPVICAVDGAAHGGGLELALACDIRIASGNATFAASGVNMGLIASVPALTATIGTTRASLMLLTGKPIDANQAAAWALASLLDNDPSARAQQMAAELAAKAPLAVEANKVALRSVGSVSFDEHEQIVTSLYTSLERSADHREAIEAFLNKRQPTFTRS